MGMLRIVTVDIGTSSVKAELVDVPADGRTGQNEDTVVAAAEHAIRTEHPAEAQVTQDAQEWFDATRACIAALRRDGAGRGSAAGDARSAGAQETGESAAPWCDAISLTGQMQDLILLDEGHRPVAPVILYSDVRASAALELITHQHKWGDWYERLPNAPGPDCIPAKLRHLDDSGHGMEEDGTPHEFELAHAMLFSASGAVAAVLTGHYVCDRLTASTTSLYDPTTGDWFPVEPIFIGHFPAPQLPRIVEPGVVGHVNAEAAAAWGLPAGLPVVVALGDAGATTEGALAGRAGGAYLYLGTTGWVAALDAAPLTAGQNRGFTRLAHPRGTLNIASLANAGSALRWGRAVLLGCDGRRGPDPESPEALAEAEAELARGLRRRKWQDVAVNPALGGERLTALGSSGARGAFSNLQFQHESCDLYAGLVAGVAQNVGRLLAALGVPDSAAALPATGGVLRSPGVRAVTEQVLGRDLEMIDTENATLRHCAQVAARALSR